LGGGGGWFGGWVGVLDEGGVRGEEVGVVTWGVEPVSMEKRGEGKKVEKNAQKK